MEPLLLDGLSLCLNNLVQMPITKSMLIFTLQDELIRLGDMPPGKERFNTPIGVGVHMFQKQSLGTIFLRAGYVQCLAQIGSVVTKKAVANALGDWIMIDEVKDSTITKWMKNFALHTVPGIVQVILWWPLEWARIRLMTDLTNGPPNARTITPPSLDQTLSQASHSPYASSVLTLQVVGILAYRGLHQGLYSLMRPLTVSASPEVQFALGFGITVLAGLFTYPIDVMSKRMTLAAMYGQPYHGKLNDTFDIMVTRDGWNGMYRGMAWTVGLGVLGAAMRPWIEQAEITMRRKLLPRTGVVVGGGGPDVAGLR